MLVVASVLVLAWRPGAPAGRAQRPAAPAQMRVLRPGTVPCFHVIPWMLFTLVSGTVGGREGRR